MSLKICDKNVLDMVRHYLYKNAKLMRFVENIELLEPSSIPTQVYPSKELLKRYTENELIHTSWGYVHALPMDTKKEVDWFVDAEDLITTKNGYQIAELKVSLKANITIYFATAFKIIKMKDFTGYCEKIDKFNPEEDILLYACYEANTPTGVCGATEEEKYKIDFRSTTNTSSFDLYISDWILHLEDFHSYDIYMDMIKNKKILPNDIKKVKKYLSDAFNSMNNSQLLDVSRFSYDMNSHVRYIKNEDDLKEYNEWFKDNKHNLDFTYSTKNKKVVAFYGIADGYEFAISRRKFLEDVMNYAFGDDNKDIDDLSDNELKTTYATLLSYIYNNDINIHFVD